MRSFSLTFVTFAVFETSVAFHVPPRSNKDTFLTTKVTPALSVHKEVGVGKEIIPSSAGNPFRELDLDMEKIHDCATHFGKYPVDEIEKMRDDIHAHRIQSLVFGSSATAAMDEALVQGRVLEDELNLQLHLLKVETPDPYLFPQVVATPDKEMEELPHLQDGTAASVHLDEEIKNIDVFEELVEEGVLESLAICALIGLVMVVPQFL